MGVEDLKVEWTLAGISCLGCARDFWVSDISEKISFCLENLVLSNRWISKMLLAFAE